MSASGGARRPPRAQRQPERPSKASQLILGAHTCLSCLRGVEADRFNPSPTPPVLPVHTGTPSAHMQHENRTYAHALTAWQTLHDGHSIGRWPGPAWRALAVTRPSARDGSKAGNTGGRRK